MNVELQKQLDLEYERMVKEANINAMHTDVDISSLNVPESEISTFTPYSYGAAHYHNIQRRRRRNRKKCSIM